MKIAKAQDLTRYLINLGAAAMFLLALATTTPAQAQTSDASQRKLNIEAAHAERKAIVGQNMYLSSEEAKVFWPLYDQYEKRMDRIEDRHIKEIKDYIENYDSLTDEAAAKKLDEVLAIQQARLDVQKEFVPRFRAAMSPIKVTRFFQIDSKLRAMVQCDIAQKMPLAQPPAAEKSGHSF
jgi:hypothetical protein